MLVIACGLLALVGPARAAADVSCPNSNPIVNENNCMGAGTSANQLGNYSEDIGGFTTQTSYNLGQSVQLKIGTDEPAVPATKVNIAIYRIGYYGGSGARLISAANNVTVNNSFTCNAPDATTGRLSCANWNVTYTIPASSLPVTGIYEAVYTDLAHGGIQNYSIFTVRNDASTSKVLYVLPIATYEAYNVWGCKSLYFDACGGADTASGDGRAVAVSFDRPFAGGDEQRNMFFGPDDAMVQWLEEQGYDVSYSDDIQTDSDPAALTHHKIDLISGHSEYWSNASFNNVLAARDAGVNIASFSANTAYWQTRYADNHRTVICYKTIQGSNSGNAAATPNDPASLGPDGLPRTADDLPQFATSTRRDPGAPAGDPNAPPGGRIGPNQPENQLWGNMYVGDNEEDDFGLTIPAGNVGGEFSTNRVWRNSGLPGGSATTLGPNLVGWEWDQIPSQAGYLAVQPPGVKRITLTDVTNPEDSFIQDAGRARATTPPPGQPSNVSAVEYRAASGALVFAAGTIQWSYGLDSGTILNQATYNIFSDMGVQPGTPEAGITLDPPNPVQPPNAFFTATPSSVLIGQNVTFDASGSTDPAGTITNYRWDLDGSGAFANNTGTTKTLTHAFSTAGTYNIVLKVTDSNGQTDVTTRTVVVSSPLVARIAGAPNPASLKQTVTVDGSSSTDLSGTITNYKWDLDGNGTYETDTGTTATASTSFTTTGAHTIGLKIQDSNGATQTTTTTINVVAIGVSRYADGVHATPSLLHYYRLDEPAGPTIHDTAGSSDGSLTFGTFGKPGAVNGDPDTSVNFEGASDPDEGNPGSFGLVPLDLSGQQAITVEFWLKWDQYSNNDSLAMEFTPNYNSNTGGFLVDPNAPEFGGTFGVAVGSGTSRNGVFFPRPSAGVWHHYAFVLDTTQSASSVITPYVDGQQVSGQQEGAGTGAGAFANSTLYLMSRAGNSLFGNGSLDELAIYGGDLSAAQVQEHADNNGTDPRPTAALSMNPSPARPGQTVTFDASASSYSRGTITKYEWDLDGNGTYETTTVTPTVTKSYATAQTVNIGLRVTDSNSGWDYITRALKIGSFPPSAKITAAPSPALVGQTVTADASGTTDQGTITDYKWDLDGNGTYETDTGTTPTANTSFATVGTHTIGVQVTDDQTFSATATTNITVLQQGVSSYPDAVNGTAGLIDYYRLGESAGPTIFDSRGSSNGTLSGGTFGLTGAVQGDANTAVGFNGTSDSGTIPLNLSGKQAITVEFWLKWNQYANNDALAMEFTPNFNSNSGGFLVDPNAPEFGGTFGIGIGASDSRNSIFFQRPSSGAWHHYVLVLDGSKPAGTEITPYVDGQPVSFQQEGAGIGTTFANSLLYLFSRGGSALLGNGSLDELAIYNQPLSAATAFQHYNSHGASQLPSASFTLTSNLVRPGQSVTFDASASTDPDASIVDYQWDLDGDGTYETDTGSNPVLTRTFATAGTYNVGLRVIDANNVSASTSHTLTVGDLAPVAKLSASPNPASTNHTVTLSAAGSTDQGTITDYKWDLDGNGTYETDTGTTQTTTTSFATVGAHTVGVQETNDHGLSTTKTLSVTVLSQSAGNYPDAVQSTPGLIDYYRLDEAAGPTILDSTGTANGSLTGGTFGAAGAILGDSDPAVSFNGSSDSGAIPLDLSATSQLTVEFWLKWNNYANDDALAMEFTPNYNANAGGFLVDPDSPQFGGTFGVGIGAAGSRNSVFFPRPSAGVWHHYAFVLDSTAPGGSVITPYVDGQPVAVQQDGSETGAGPFANSTLYLMSRAGSALYGAGALDELAIYNQPLSAPTVFQHYNSHGVINPITPAFTISPTTAVTGQNVTFDASGSSDTGGAINSYKWDLDGDGSYETDGGSNPVLTHVFTTPGTYTVGVKVSDDGGSSATTTHTLLVNASPPSTPALTLSGATGNTSINASTVYTNPQSGNAGGFTVAASTSDAFTGIQKVTFPTLSGFSSGGGADTSSPYQSAYTWTGAASASGAQTVTATNNANVSSSSSFTIVSDTSAPTGGALTVNGTNAGSSSSYSTSGNFTIGTRTDFAETRSGTQSGLASSTLTLASATLAGNSCSAFGAPSTIVGSPAQSKPTGCYRYTLTGTDNVGNTTSVTTTVMVDTGAPSTPTLSFSGMSNNAFYKSAGNTLYFSPSHSGGFTVIAASTDADTGIGGYTFSSLSANGFTSTQTGGQNVYVFGTSATQPATAPTVFATNNAGSSSANASFGLVSDTTAPTGGALTVNATAASAAGSASFSTSGSFTIGTRTDYNADSGSGLISSVLTRAAGTLSGNACSAYGTPTTLTGSPAQSGLGTGCYLYTLTGTDAVGNTASVATTVKVDKTAPSPTISVPAAASTTVPVTFGATDANSGVNAATGQLKRSVGTYTLSTDACSAFAAFANIGAAGQSSPFSDNTVGTGHCYQYQYTVADQAGNSASSSIVTSKVSTTKPALTGIVDTTPGTTSGLPQVGNAITLQFSEPIAASSIPASVTLAYSRPLLGATMVTVSGIGSGGWGSGDASTGARYAKALGSATVTASTLVSGATIRLTITSISDPSGNLTAGGPAPVTGTLNAAVKDPFGNTASTSAFTSASIRLF
ncbi:MAG TPA: N,N-dimethylformamidase beta subunit family domain-containing protein [Solirubrobacteraceae bacterium]|nr:N,N-dimethylformamidase beta subunit family domain-containing protein [Solirubrobacteraceae bacterium]